MKKNEECKGMLFRMCVKKACADGHRFQKKAGLYDWFWKMMGNSGVAQQAQRRQGVPAASGVQRAGTIGEAQAGRMPWNRVPADQRQAHGLNLLQQQQAGR